MTRPYRPSNGTEGILFCESFCFRCARDENEDCPIFSNTLIYDPDSPHYPAEWVCDDGDDKLPLETARCTAFVPIGADLELEAARCDPRQMGLPV